MFVVTLLGIAAPALLLVAALRRWIVEVPWRTALLFLVLTFAFLHGAVFTTKLPVPVDEVARGYPYRARFGELQAKNPLTNDTVKLFLPWMQVAREELAHGRAPLWNRYSFSGYPLLGNGEAAPFSPLFLATLFVPLPKQLVAMAGLKLFVALLFTYLFARRMGASEVASCAAAVAFAWCSFQTVYLYYSTASVTAFLPAALFALFYAHARIGPVGRRGVVFVALIVGTLMANGHPESVLHIAIAAAGLFAIDLALAADRRDWLARFRFPVQGAIAGLLLSAPAWLPTLQQVLLSTRLADLRRGAHDFDYPLTMLWAMVMPNGFGNPVRGNWDWLLNYSIVATSYAGLLVLTLAIAAGLSRRTETRDRIWLAFAVVLWLVALDWSFVGHALNAVPPFSITANDKLRFIAIFLGIIVAARFADRLRERVAPMLFVAALPLVALALYVWRLRAAVLRSADLVAVGGVVLFCVLVLKLRRFAPQLLFVFVALELFVLNAGFNALVDGRFYRPRVPILEALRNAAPPEPFRIAGFDWMFLPNASAQYGFEDIRGADPMSFDFYTEYLKRISHDDPDIDTDRIVNVDDPAIDRLNVRFLLAEPGAAFDPAHWKPIYGGADGTLFENRRAQPRFFAEGAEVTVRRYEAARVELAVNAKQAVRLRSSHVAAPGWRVTVNGRHVPLEREEAFVVVALPAGRCTVALTYRPLAFYGALALALLGLALCWFRRP
ncbi:MAG TPA: hypothetical protein VF618_00595 [Thermoanaerobaculia bacterium]